MLRRVRSAEVSEVGTWSIRRSGNRALWLMGLPLLLLGLLVVAAPLLPLADPGLQDLRARLLPPIFLEGGTWEHPLGTDQLGRDLLARVIYGGRLTFVIAIAAVLVGSVFGTLLGMIAGYRRGWIDTIISRVVDAQLALPFILLAIAIIVSRGRSLVVLVAVLAIISWAQYARVIRAEALSLRERPFILGLRAAGASPIRIIIHHIFPNIGGTVLVLATLEVGTMILAESALSFLGLGVVPPDISWGGMLAGGREFIQDAWWVVTFPGIAITFVVMSINLLGDALRARYDPRKRTYL
ncbi:MAG: ABC transporter permease [bacterium]|nr:ABC transporter permease [bacterium]